MATGSSSEVKFEIGHVLFIDIVGYSKLRIDEQKERLHQLTDIVLASAQVKESTNEQLVRLPTGDGMALVFRNSSEEPARCALEIAQALKKHPEVLVRMGIHSGPVSEVVDVNGRTNIAGAGINFAQRVMDCGDAGHILVSRHVAEDLEHYPRWKHSLHDLGECEVKHGVRLGVVNLYHDSAGNPQLPKKVRASRLKQKRRKWAAMVSALTIFLLAAAVLFFFSHAKSVVAAPIRSVAVMPLVNTSGDPSNEYFSDGLSEELIAVLAKIPGLKVIGRNSSFEFKGKAGDSAGIGQKLGVAQLIQGSVHRQGNQVRVVAEMIKASTGEALWSDTFDAEVKDVLAIQSKIAQAVATQLKIKLLGENPADSAPSGPNPEAHDLLLKAGFYSRDGNLEGLRKAIGYAEEATGADPKSADAWAVLSTLWRGYAVTFATDDIDQAYTSARIAADKAFALDPNSIGALFARWGLALTPDLDFRSAEKYARRSYELAPGDVGSLTILSSSLVAQGKLEEADRLRREVDTADPLLPGNWYEDALILVGLQRYSEARAVFSKFLQMRPKAARVHTQLATLDILENNPKGALEHASLEHEGIWRDFATAMALEANVDQPAAHAALQAFIDKYAKVASFQVACLYGQRHEPDEMFKWLETAYANRDAGLSRIFVIPFFMNYRDDPRFAAFCRKLGIESLPPKP